MTDMPPFRCSLEALQRAWATSPSAYRRRCGRSLASLSLRTSFGQRRERLPRVVTLRRLSGGENPGLCRGRQPFRNSGLVQIDGPKLFGTDGALRAALDVLGSEFLVMYGDSWLDIPYAPVVESFRQNGQPTLITVVRNEGQWDTSNVWFDDGHIRLYESASACRRCGTSIGASASSGAKRWRCSQRASPSISATSTQPFHASAGSQVTRSRPVSMKSVRMTACVTPMRCCVKLKACSPLPCRRRRTSSRSRANIGPCPCRPATAS